MSTVTGNSIDVNTVLTLKRSRNASEAAISTNTVIKSGDCVTPRDLTSHTLLAPCSLCVLPPLHTCSRSNSADQNKKVRHCAGDRGVSFGGRGVRGECTLLSLVSLSGMTTDRRRVQRDYNCPNLVHLFRSKMRVRPNSASSEPDRRVSRRSLYPIVSSVSLRSTTTGRMPAEYVPTTITRRSIGLFT